MATTITGTTIDVGPNKLLVNSSGNVGIGTSSPDERLHVMESSAGNVTAHTESVIVAERNGNCYFSAIGTTGAGLLMANTAGNEIGRINYGFSNNSMQFYTNNATNMTITSTGQVAIGSPSAVSNDFVLNLKAKAGQSTVILQSNNGYDAVSFHNAAGSQNGFIRSSASSVAYNTSSDYRLKENVTPISGATAQTKLLKPCNFDWIVGGNVNGFLAHELADVVPEAVTGTKDAMKDEEYEVTAAVLDAEGNETTAAVMGTRSVPDMQGIDQSKIVPLLTATIQELITRIEALEGI